MKYLEFNEKKQHGSTDFPIQYYHLTSTHQQYVMPLHWHKEFEIIRVLSGTFNAFIDNIEYVMYPGDVVLVECGMLHRGIPDDCIYECVVFDINMLRKKHNDILGKYLIPILNHTVKVKSFFKGNAFPEFLNIINTIFNELRVKKNFYELTVYSLIYKLFYILYSNNYIVEYVESKRYGKQIKILMELLDWIEANYTEPISLSDLSRISGMNDKYLCRFFKEFTSRTPIDYINNLRIECACHEMTANRLTITEAALESGFNDLSYFSKTFKKYKNMSPREFLKSSVCI